ncbi:hypothetical protein J608_5584, partial [Acinetobacter baumannii 1288284]
RSLNLMGLGFFIGSNIRNSQKNIDNFTSITTSKFY